MPKAHRVTEADVAVGVTKYLVSVSGHTATIHQIKKALPNYMNLSTADREQSETRPNEEMWEQQVRNIVSHRETPGNFIHEGRFRHSPRRLTLTDAGRIFAQSL